MRYEYNLGLLMRKDGIKPPVSWVQSSLSFINNPVILRELTVRMRKLSTFVFLGILLLTGWVGLLLIWNEITGPHSSYFLQSRSREIFMILNFFLGVSLAIMVPIFSATSINTEYEQETWELLSTTPLSKFAILIGKFLSSIFLIWIMGLAIIPIYGICFTIGSISPGEVTFVFVLLTETCVIISLIGILCSARCRKTITSITLTYILGTSYVILLPFLRVIFLQLRGPNQFGPEMVISPFVAAICFFYNESLPTGVGTTIQNYPLVAHFIMNALLALVFTFLCWWSIQKDRQPQNPTRRFQKLRQFFPWFRRRRPTESSIEASLKTGLLFHLFPVFWKEWRKMYRDRTLRFLKAHIGYLLCSFFFCIQLAVEPDYIGILAFLHFLFVPLITMPYAANCFRYEWDQKTWELLSTTTIHPIRIWAGKFFVGFFLFNIRYWLIYFLPLLIALNTLAIQRVSSSTNYWLIGIVFLAYCMAILFLCMGSAISVYSKSSVNAYVIAFSLVILYYSGIPLFYFIGDNLFNIVSMRTLTHNDLLAFLTPVNMIIYIENAQPNGGWLNVYHTLWVLTLCSFCFLAAMYKLNQARGRG